MSHVPSSEPPSDIIVGSYAIDQSAAMKSAGVVEYTFIGANVNMAAASGTLTTLYTTEANRGRFVAVAIQVVIQKGIAGGGVAPQISIGYTGGTYTDLVGATNLTIISTSPAYGPNLFENVSTIAVKTLATSVPASTAIICRLVTGSAQPADLRSIGILGFYTGG